MTRRQVIKKALLLFLAITALSAILIYLQNRIGLDKIRETITLAGVWGPVIYIFLHLITQIVAPIQGSPFYFLALAVFGKWAVIYLYIVVAISSFTNFWIARKFGREIVVKLVGREGMAKVDHIATHEGVKALIIMRLFQGIINDFISYAAGFTSMKFSIYIAVSLIVPIPWTLISFFFFNLIPQEQIFAWGIVIGLVFFILPPLYYWLKHRISAKRILHRKFYKLP